MRTINTETNQSFLRLMYLLQNNRSNAVIYPKLEAKKLLDCEVYFDCEKNKFTIHPPNTEKKPENLGGRPKCLTDEQIQNILQETCSESNRKVAKRYKVSEGTIRNVLKQFKK